MVDWEGGWSSKMLGKGEFIDREILTHKTESNMTLRWPSGAWGCYCQLYVKKNAIICIADVEKKIKILTEVNM